MRLAALAIALPLALAMSTDTQAQNFPKRKAGLWEIQYGITGGPGGPPSIAEHLASMPPDERAKAQAYLQSHGMGMAGNMMTQHFCLTPEEAADDTGERFLSRLRKDAPSNECQRRIVDRTATSVHYHTTCRIPDGGTAEMDARISDMAPERFTAEVNSKSTEGLEFHLQEKGRWVAADCGGAR